MTWTNLLHYSGQVLLILAATEVMLRLLRVRDSNLRLRVLQFALLACIVLPFVQPRLPESKLSTSAVMGPSTTAFVFKAGLTLPVMPIWAAGCALVLLRLGFGLIGLRRLRSNSRAYQFRDNVPIHVSKSLASPVAFGLFKPIVLLPEKCLDLDSSTREPMVAHELAHIARKDWLFVITEELIRAGLWFHPAVWWTLTQIRSNRELAIDCEVSARAGADDYTESLLTAASWRAGGVPARPLPATAMYSGGSLKRRLHLIQNIKETQMTRIHRAAAVGILSFATLATIGVASSTLPLFAQEQQDDIVKAKLILKTTPAYPPEAKEQRIQGTVKLGLTIGLDGKAVNIQVKDGNSLLAEAAVDSVKEWEFEPARKGGKAVESRVDIEINFTLK